MTAPGTPVAAGAFAISSEPCEDQPRPVPHDSAGGAEGHPERADLCSIRQWHPPSERSKYSAIRSGAGPEVGSRTVTGADLQPCRVSAGGRKMVSLCLLREATDGSNGGCIACTGCRAAWPPATPARAPAGPGRAGPVGKMDGGTALSREGCEMTGGAKAMQPEEVTRLVAERLNAGDAAGMAALCEPRAVLACPAEEPVTGREAIPAICQQMAGARGDVRCRDPAARRPVRGSGADLNPLGRRHRRAGAGAAPPARRLLAADRGPARGPAALAAAGTSPGLRPRGQRVPARGKPRCGKVSRAQLGRVSRRGPCQATPAPARRTPGARSRCYRVQGTSYCDRGPYAARICRSVSSRDR
jgi:hypothetical protein